MKRYWLKEELSCADELLSYVPKLLEEFLAYHTDFINGSYSKGIPVAKLLPGAKDFVASDIAYPWKTEPMKYTWKSAGVNDCYYKTEHAQRHFPTAVALTERFELHSGLSCYSILEKNTVITRHTGHENRDNEFVRIHIPLLIPNGDIFFECEGYEIDWTEIWGFDNQLIHSAHNTTDQRRLVYFIDIERAYIGLPPQPAFDPARELTIPPFTRGALPRVLHQHQR